MRFSTFLNNKKCMEWKLNAQQGILFSLLYDCSNWAKEVIVDGQTYYFISRNLVINELPMFFEKPDTVYRNLKVLQEKGLIEYAKQGKKDLIRITEKGKSWNKFKENESDKNPDFKENSEKNPNELGKKSEKEAENSEKNPTNKRTNYIKKTNYKKENNKKEKIADFVNSLKKDESYKQLLFEFVKYRSEIGKKLKTTIPITELMKEFDNYEQLKEAIEIMRSREWVTAKAEWIENYKNSQGGSNGNNKRNNGKKNESYKPDYSKGFEDWN